MDGKQSSCKGSSHKLQGQQPQTAKGSSHELQRAAARLRHGYSYNCPFSLPPKQHFCAPFLRSRGPGGLQAEAFQEVFSSRFRGAASQEIFFRRFRGPAGPGDLLQKISWPRRPSRYSSEDFAAAAAQAASCPGSGDEVP